MNAGLSDFPAPMLGWRVAGGGGDKRRELEEGEQDGVRKERWERGGQGREESEASRPRVGERQTQRRRSMERTVSGWSQRRRQRDRPGKRKGVQGGKRGPSDSLTVAVPPLPGDRRLPPESLSTQVSSGARGSACGGPAAGEGSSLPEPPLQDPWSPPPALTSEPQEGQQHPSASAPQKGHHPPPGNRYLLALALSAGVMCV